MHVSSISLKNQDIMKYNLILTSFNKSLKFSIMYTRYLRVIIVSGVFLILFMTSSCKTCKCPAYSNYSIQNDTDFSLLAQK